MPYSSGLAWGEDTKRGKMTATSISLFLFQEINIPF